MSHSIEECECCGGPVTHEMHHVFGKDCPITMRLCMTCHDMVSPKRIDPDELFWYVVRHQGSEPAPLWAKWEMLRHLWLIGYSGSKYVGPTPDPACWI